MPLVFKILTMTRVPMAVFHCRQGWLGPGRNSSILRRRHSKLFQRPLDRVWGHPFATHEDISRRRAFAVAPLGACPDRERRNPPVTDRRYKIERRRLTTVCIVLHSVKLSCYQQNSSSLPKQLIMQPIKSFDWCFSPGLSIIYLGYLFFKNVIRKK